jgi:hypothetical protein
MWQVYLACVVQRGVQQSSGTRLVWTEPEAPTLTGGAALRPRTSRRCSVVGGAADGK